ncbi:hypothetical protein C0Q70_14109 [Pomacea canaliculata]|uniref:Globin n=1 Tax=Pomacea canaliculata TaxID=400727 RepID=A0A2T7NZ38_POMCA|nr:hypothetical protein C0Q70_14109 [Pomacea canaliculata]
MHCLTHPEVQSVFLPFRGKSHEDLQDSPQLKSHALRVMGTVETCMNHIHQLQELHQTLHDLGARHVMYNAKVDYIDVGGERCHLIGPQFIWAIEPVVGDQWTPEVEQAWSDLFKLIAHIMKDAMTF